LVRGVHHGGSVDVWDGAATLGITAFDLMTLGMMGYFVDTTTILVKTLPITTLFIKLIITVQLCFNCYK
jgi:hypothetical protein